MKGKTTLVVGSGSTVLSHKVATIIAEKYKEITLIEASEVPILLNEPEPMIITNPYRGLLDIVAPITRKQRREQERKNKKNLNK